MKRGEYRKKYWISEADRTFLRYIECYEAVAILVGNSCIIIESDSKTNDTAQSKSSKLCENENFTQEVSHKNSQKETVQYMYVDIL